MDSSELTIWQIGTFNVPFGVVLVFCLLFIYLSDQLFKQEQQDQQELVFF